MRIADVMTADLPTVSSDDSIREAAVRMADARVKALPVCDQARLTGIITDWDVTRAVAECTDLSKEPVRGYMSTDLVAAPPDAQLTDAGQMMADRRIHHLLVRDGDQFAGMVHLDVEWSALGGLDTPIATFSAPI
jgi:CBS domain-containing protein